MLLVVEISLYIYHDKYIATYTSSPIHHYTHHHYTLLHTHHYTHYHYYIYITIYTLLYTHHFIHMLCRYSDGDVDAPPLMGEKTEPSSVIDYTIHWPAFTPLHTGTATFDVLCNTITSPILSVPCDEFTSTLDRLI